MATRRFTAAEKGKHIPTLQKDANRKRIRAPDFDTSALIRDNALTLMGRVTNAKEQPIEHLITSLPRNWSLRGRVTGSDLGRNCFQFRFELEEDMLEVLSNRPYSYHHWMVILQKWEPSISPSFPSLIPLWIRLQGLPLHFWHEKMVNNIGKELGTVEKTHISKTSAKMRILLDGLQPLTMEAAIDFDSGEEVLISLDYEDLKSHCTSCFKLCHLTKDCPLLPPSREVPQNRRDALNYSSAPAVDGLIILPSQSPTTREHRRHEPFHQRVDRHGRPFGERVHLPTTRGRPLKNKLAPPTDATRRYDEAYPPLRKEPHQNLQWREKAAPQESARQADQLASSPPD